MSLDDPTSDEWLTDNFRFDPPNAWTRRPSGVIDVAGSITWAHYRFHNDVLPVKFGYVIGDVLWDKIWIRSWEGTPREIGGVFRIHNASFNDMEGCPVAKSYDVSQCNLLSLSGSPRKAEYFNAWGNRLKTLEGGPHEVTHFSISQNRDLGSLQGGPQVVSGDYSCQLCGLEDLVGAPEEVRGNFDCTVNRLRSLNGLPKRIGGKLKISYSDTLPLLRLGLTTFSSVEVKDNDRLSELIMSTLGENHVGSNKSKIRLQAALVKNGYDGNAL